MNTFAKNYIFSYMLTDFLLAFIFWQAMFLLRFQPIKMDPNIRSGGIYYHSYKYYKHQMKVKSKSAQLKGRY